MIRRALLFIAVVSGLLITPLGQAPSASKVFHIGYFVARGPDPATDGAFLRGLRELGYVAGRNIVIERRFAYNKAEALPVLAAELAGMKLDLIVVAPINTALAMKKATSTMPIVMANGGEPVRVG
ncbi:MAG: ABC transporter substrate binding protein, partial [Sulfuricaulis sp.]